MMGHDMNEYMVYLRQNATELRDLGSDWGMTEEEIRSCIDEALFQCQNVGELEKSPKNFARKIWSHIRLLIKLSLYLFLVVLLLVLFLSVLMTYHEPSERYISTTLQPYGYNIFRYLRLATLPVHQLFTVSNLYEAECLVENPFYTEPDINCFSCMNFKSAKEVNASDFSPDQLHIYVSMRKPILFKKSLVQEVEYKDLREVYLGDPDTYDANTYQFKSDHGPIQNVRDLFWQDQESVIKLEGALRIDWQSRRVGNSVGLRSLFPRPVFLPDKAEISLEKHVLIDSPDTQTYELPYMAIPTQLLTLGSGTRRVLVRAHDSCVNQCPGILLHMKAGDSLFVGRDVWRVFLLPNGRAPSVGYLTSITV